jgi:acyl carrier protein
MKKEEFLAVVRDQFIEDNLDLISLDVDFRTLDSWDSLTGMAVLAIVEDDYDVTIPVEEFRKLNTIQELYDYVISKH